MLKQTPAAAQSIFQHSYKLPNNSDKKRSYIGEHQINDMKCGKKAANLLTVYAKGAFEQVIDEINIYGDNISGEFRDFGHKKSALGLLVSGPGAINQEMHSDTCPVANRRNTTKEERERHHFKCDLSMILPLQKEYPFHCFLGSNNYLCGRSSAVSSDLTEVMVPAYHVLVFDSTMVHRGPANPSDTDYHIRLFGKFTTTDVLCNRAVTTAVCVSDQQKLYTKSL